MQGKLIAVAYTLRTYWGGICKQEKMDSHPHPPPPRQYTGVQKMRAALK